VPPNSSDQPVEYGVEVQAYDTNGAYVASLIGGVQEEASKVRLPVVPAT
jgi:hypothetical protein